MARLQIRMMMLWQTGKEERLFKWVKESRHCTALLNKTLEVCASVWGNAGKGPKKGNVCFSPPERLLRVTSCTRTNTNTHMRNYWNSLPNGKLSSN
jgi:hypothetical protein